MKQIKVGDLVMLTNKSYKYLKAGSVGIVTHANGILFNVTLPQGKWAFPRGDLKLLTEETTCTR